MVQFKKGGNTMYVIFNQDGSIKETQLGKYVNQHSKGVDFVDVAIDGRTNEDYACDANFALPNDTNVTETAQINNKIVTSSGTYGGYRIGFNEAETEYDGDLSCSIRVYNKDGSVLWTFPFSIVVNKTTGYGDENITNDQYESLVRSMANYQLMFSKTNVRSYETLDEANEDLASMAEGQLVFIKNGDARGVYAKKGDSFEMQSLDALSLDKYLKKEVIEGTWDTSKNTFTLSKDPTSIPFIADFGNEKVLFTAFDNSSHIINAYIGLLERDGYMYAFTYRGNGFMNNVEQHPFMPKASGKDMVLSSQPNGQAVWSSLKTINSQSLLGAGDIPTGGDIETINGTIIGDTAVTLEKAITKIPVLLHLQTEEEMVHYDFLVFSGISLGDTSYYSSLATMNFVQIEQSSKLDIVTIEVNGGTTAVILRGFMLQEPSNIDSGAKLVPTIRKNAQDETIVEWYPFMTEPLKDSCVLASKLSEKNKTEWQSLKTVGGQSLLGTGNIDIGGTDFQSKTFLHSLTAKGATLSMSFTYPSTNQLPVDSQQDATTVIKPTANEYFASPVVVVATKKLSDSYNCIYYNGTLWKFALWDGTSFTDGEAVTTWADSVVSVD